MKERPPLRHYPQILSASISLTSICFVIIGALKLTNQNSRSYSDEIAWLAVTFLCTSTVMAYFAVRNEGAQRWQTLVADWAFLGGLLFLVTSVAVGATQL